MNTPTNDDNVVKDLWSLRIRYKQAKTTHVLVTTLAVLAWVTAAATNIATWLSVIDIDVVAVAVCAAVVVTIAAVVTAQRMMHALDDFAAVMEPQPPALKLHILDHVTNGCSCGLFDQPWACPYRTQPGLEHVTVADIVAWFVTTRQRRRHYLITFVTAVAAQAVMTMAWSWWEPSLGQQWWYTPLLIGLSLSYLLLMVRWMMAEARFYFLLKHASPADQAKVGHHRFGRCDCHSYVAAGQYKSKVWKSLGLS